MMMIGEEEIELDLSPEDLQMIDLIEEGNPSAMEIDNSIYHSNVSTPLNDSNALKARMESLEHACMVRDGEIALLRERLAKVSLLNSLIIFS